MYYLELEYSEKFYTENLPGREPAQGYFVVRDAFQRKWINASDDMTGTGRDVDYAQQTPELVINGDWWAKMLSPEEEVRIRSMGWWNRTYENAKEMADS